MGGHRIPAQAGVDSFSLGVRLPVVVYYIAEWMEARAGSWAFGPRIVCSLPESTGADQEAGVRTIRPRSLGVGSAGGARAADACVSQGHKSV